MAKILSNAVTWIIILLVAILVLLAGIVFGWWGDEGEPLPSPTASATPSLSPTPGGPTFVERPVTTGEYLPDAEALTAAVLGSAGTGWVVAINDSTQIDTSVPSHPRTPGPKVLYLMSPQGDRYELANLDTLGLDAPDLVAWDDTRNLVLIEQDRMTLNVFDMATGVVDSSWVFCLGGAGKALYGEARDGNWLVRGGCEGAGVDGLYTNAGTLVPSSIVGHDPFVTVVDVGDVQVTWEWEGLVDQKFVAVYPDGTSQPLPWNSAGHDCYPLGKGRGATVAMYCYTAAASPHVWELPVDGTAPEQVVSSTQVEDFAASEGGYGPGEFWVSRYCSDSALKVVQFSLGIGDDTTQRLGVLYGGTVEPVGQIPFRYRVCHAVEGTASLVSGDGHLWWVDFDTGTNITLLPGSGSDSPIQVVGTDGYTALRLP